MLDGQGKGKRSPRHQNRVYIGNQRSSRELCWEVCGLGRDPFRINYKQGFQIIVVTKWDEGGGPLESSNLYKRKVVLDTCLGIFRVLPFSTRERNGC